MIKPIFTNNKFWANITFVTEDNLLNFAELNYMGPTLDLTAGEIVK